MQHNADLGADGTVSVIFSDYAFLYHHEFSPLLDVRQEALRVHGVVTQLYKAKIIRGEQEENRRYRKIHPFMGMIFDGLERLFPDNRELIRTFEICSRASDRSDHGEPPVPERELTGFDEEGNEIIHTQYNPESKGHLRIIAPKLRIEEIESALTA